jgi:hypothetical protein
LQCIDTLFLLLDTFCLFAELVGLCLFEAGFFELMGSLFYTLLVLFDHSTQGVLLLFIGFVFEDGFEFQQVFRCDFAKRFD